MFFDGGHHSENTNLQLAELFWNGTEDVIGPLYNFKELFELDLTPRHRTTSAMLDMQESLIISMNKGCLGEVLFDFTVCEV